MWVEVKGDDVLTSLGSGYSKRGRQGGFPDAALLRDERDDSHTVMLDTTAEKHGSLKAM